MFFSKKRWGWNCGKSVFLRRPHVAWHMYMYITQLFLTGPSLAHPTQTQPHHHYSNQPHRPQQQPQRQAANQPQPCPFGRIHTLPQCSRSINANSSQLLHSPHSTHASFLRPQPHGLRRHRDVDVACCRVRHGARVDGGAAGGGPTDA